jgi:hypothetical protein
MCVVNYKTFTCASLALLETHKILNETNVHQKKILFPESSNVIFRKKKILTNSKIHSETDFWYAFRFKGMINYYVKNRLSKHS